MGQLGDGELPAPVVPGCDAHIKFSPNAGKVGLKNLGNTCFMNAGLQCLCHIEPLVAHFLNGHFKKDLNADNPLSCGGGLARAFEELVVELWQSTTGGAHDPSALHKKLRTFAPHLFESGDQQDVHEFLAFFLDGLHEDLNRVRSRPPPPTEDQQREDERLSASRGEEFAAALAWLRHMEHGKSFLVDLLQGQLRSTLSCRRCGHTSRRFDPFLYLALPVSKSMTSVSDALETYLEEETLTGSEQWYCERCRQKVDATKKIDLWKLPPVLVLQLKRFEFDAAAKGFVKTENRLMMKLSLLDLQEYCSSTQRDGAVYDVVCVANHSGQYGNGHYTASCRVGGMQGGTWHHFDDDCATKMSGRKVVTKETYVIFLAKHETPEDKPTWLRGAQQKSRRVLMRRQSQSMPDNWPHPSASVSAVLSATASRCPPAVAEDVQVEAAVEGKEAPVLHGSATQGCVAPADVTAVGTAASSIQRAALGAVQTSALTPAAAENARPRVVAKDLLKRRRRKSVDVQVAPPLLKRQRTLLDCWTP
eukprot:TRINITY_DN12806_c0_g1_i1.p1 TRINITY_DN12806_c0_g1~~TRINITY_DN12806_c0_g1_i1.p1  ORF type:complete len:533 (-),score=107.48 TRINITY_DN12806_c0_g1_i1:250-1848(-)